MKNFPHISAAKNFWIGKGKEYRTRESGDVTIFYREDAPVRWIKAAHTEGQDSLAELTAMLRAPYGDLPFTKEHGESFRKWTKRYACFVDADSRLFALLCGDRCEFLTRGEEGAEKLRDFVDNFKPQNGR